MKVNKHLHTKKLYSVSLDRSSKLFLSSTWRVVASKWDQPRSNVIRKRFKICTVPCDYTHAHTHAHTHCQRHKHKHAQTLQYQTGYRGNKFTAFVNLATQLHTIIICMCLFLCIYWNDWWYSGFVFVQKEVCIFGICILEVFLLIFFTERVFILYWK